MNVYNTPLYDDFTGFTFNGKHSSEFGLLRVSNGDRYEDTFVLPHSDEVANIPGGPGQYYWGEQTKQREFKVKVAYDNIGEVEKRRIRQWLHPDGKLHELIFDERPYVKYWVKCAKEVVTEELCFNEYDITKSTTYPYDTIKTLRRVYKGEFEIQFVAYMPYGLAVSKNLADFAPGGKFEAPNYEEWAESSRLSDYEPQTIFNIYPNTDNYYALIDNPGDIEYGVEIEFQLFGSYTSLFIKPPELLTKQYYIPTSDFQPEDGKDYFIIYNGLFTLYNQLTGTIELITNSPFYFVADSGEVYEIYEKKETSKKEYSADFTKTPDFVENSIIYLYQGTLYQKIQNLGQIYITQKGDSSFSFYFIKDEIDTQSLSGVLLVAPSTLQTISINRWQLWEGPTTNNKSLELNFDGFSTVPSENWTEAQKLRFFGGSVKINTDKKIVSGKFQNSTDWFGISGIAEGEFFKILKDVDDTSQNRKTNLDIIPSEPNMIGTPTLSYNYLYI